VGKYVIEKSMNKSIEADFFLREPELQFSGRGSIAKFAVRQHDAIEENMPGACRVLSHA
jgi:hypothetical protein